MPAGDINPREDTFTVTGMLLSNENYPETVQNALARNTGALLYTPRMLCADSSSLWDVSAHAGTRYGIAFLPTGTYDIVASVYMYVGDGGYGSAYLSIDGSTILAAEVEGTSETITSGTLADFTWSDGLVILRCAANGTTEHDIYSWSVQARRVT